VKGWREPSRVEDRNAETSISIRERARDGKCAHVSSFVISLELRLFLSPPGSGGGDDEPCGEFDFRRDDLLELRREGVR
jgi:hypothetical protein